MFKIGTAKTDMTYFEPNIGLFGYGQYDHRAIGVETPLYARAFVIEDSNTNVVAMVCCEIQSCTISLKEAVVEKLQQAFVSNIFSEQNVLITAQHTHSAPGGYSHYPFYNFSTPGFHQGVLDAYTNAVVKSIQKAYQNRVEGELSYHTGFFDVEVPVAYNRSLSAYNANKDITKVRTDEEYLAVDREMEVLKFVSKEGKNIGCLNFFGVHTTTVGNSNDKICSDNKGYAAQFLEEEYRKQYDSFVGAFAQKPCGDVSSIYTNPKTKIKNNLEGCNNDYEKAQENGKYQFQLAKKISEEKGAVLSGNVDFHLDYANLTQIKIDSEISGRGEALRTGPACFGVPFFKGTIDGKGIEGILAVLAEGITSLANWIQKGSILFRSKEGKERLRIKYQTQTVKNIFLESSEKRILGMERFGFLPKSADKLVEVLIDHFNSDSLEGYPLTPDIVPMQLIKLGEILLVGMPGEMTVISGKRLKKFILESTKDLGIQKVIIVPYSNAYCGYVTTPEEYRYQKYEGGHTMYGEYTLWGYMTEFKKLCKEFHKQREDRIFSSLRPPKFTKEILDKRSYQVPTH